MKEKFLVALDRPEAEFVASHAGVFGSNSAVLRLMVRLVISLTAAGIIRWNFLALEGILRGNTGNPVVSGTGELSGQLCAKGGSGLPRKELLRANHQDRPDSEDVPSRFSFLLAVDTRKPRLGSVA